MASSARLSNVGGKAFRKAPLARKTLCWKTKSSKSEEGWSVGPMRTCHAEIFAYLWWARSSSFDSTLPYSIFLLTCYFLKVRQIKKINSPLLHQCDSLSKLLESDMSLPWALPRILFVPLSHCDSGCLESIKSKSLTWVGLFLNSCIGN